MQQEVRDVELMVFETPTKHLPPEIPLLLHKQMHLQHANHSHAGAVGSLIVLHSQIPRVHVFLKYL